VLRAATKVRQSLWRVHGVVPNSKFGAVVFSVSCMKVYRRRLALIDKQRRPHPAAMLETTAGRARLVDPFPTESDQDGRVVGGDGFGVSLTLEDHLGADQLAGSTANDAADEPQVRPIDEFRRQFLGIAESQIGCRWAFRIRPGQEAARKLAQLAFALGLRRSTAHRMTSRPPM
jgi:hypothetical protein